MEEENFLPNPVSQTEKNFSKSKLKKIIFPIFIVILIAGLFFAGFYFWKEKFPKAPLFSQTYRLVEEKISQSAAIKINLPPNVNKDFAKNHIKFEPEIKGKWLNDNKFSFFNFFAFAKEEESNFIFFKPDEKLKLNHHYLVTLSTPDGGQIKADFLTVEDPEIVAIFPKENSESPEDTEITIVFNRPMVPLTTLSQLENQEWPVEINPKTEGRFKWISTNVLQFIPKERLIRSSHYQVKVKDGLSSMEGLPVKGKEIEFTTRQLRYLNITEGQIIYNQPISIYFNQPVDLERTKREIVLINKNTGQVIPFVAQYQKEKEEKISEKSEKNNFFGFDFFGNFFAKILPDFEKNDSKEVNQSIIQIYPQKDRFGREKLWDFETNYSLEIKRAYPLEGDIVLQESKKTNVFVPGPIKNISAQSERSRWVNPQFFDPQGKLWVEFYEEIDLAKSKITANYLKEINYGEKCKEEEKVFFQNTNCEKVPDKKKIYLTFHSEKIGLEERWTIDFEKIVNSQGLTVNKETIREDIVSYPRFKILRTKPENNSSGAELTELVLCTNSPLFSPKKEDLDKYFKANSDYEINYWGYSWRVDYLSEGEICQLGEFETVVSYGLAPNRDYSLELNLEDVFGQKEKLFLNFKTGEMPFEQLSFYHLQSYYNVTEPKKTKLTFASQNMEYVLVDICKLPAKNFLFHLLDTPEFYQGPEVITDCQERKSDRLQFPKKYWIKNYFQFDIKNYFENPIGHYIITFYHPDYKGKFWEKGEEFWRLVYERSYLTVTNLAFSEKKISLGTGNWGDNQPLTSETLKELKNLYWVVNLKNLEPVEGARIDLYQRNPERENNFILANSIFSDQQGLAFANPTFNLVGGIASKDEDSAVLMSQSDFEWNAEAFSNRKIYLYTDKPIYRPGQEVFIKGIYRVGYDGNYQIIREKPINLKIFNSKGDEIFNQDLTISDFGTFNTKIILENNVPLGTYRICAINSYSCASFEVLEYQPAAFEVKLKTDKEEYISKDTVNLEVEAKYYFGVPLEGGEVEYTISSQNYYFDKYQDEYFSFGNNWYYYWYDYPYWSYGEKFILRGKTKLNEEGKAKISEVLDLEKLFKEEERKSKIIVFDVTVKNTLGQSISAQKSFILHAGQFYLGLKTDKSFCGKNEKFKIKVKSVDINGKETKVKNAKLEIYKVNWVWVKRQEATGGYNYKWDKKRDLIKSFDFETDEKGNYSLETQLEKEGEYEIEAKAFDKNKNLISSLDNIYIWGEGEVNVKPTNDTSLEIEPEKTNLKIGEQGKVIIKSPYSRAKALISIERGKIFDYQIKEINGNLYQFSFPVKEEYLPNVFVSVLLLSDKPEVKFGKAEFQIDTEKQELNIEVKSNKKFYLPGEEVVLEISTTDWKDQPVSAECSIAVVDLSVLALKGNPKKNPLIFFYSGFPLTVSTASNIKNILVEREITTKGGGGRAADLAAKKRGIFKETAFWQANVQTDDKGKAVVRFTLPDNLTTWQSETVGVTKDTKLGTSYIEFLTKKELMAVPFKPRFVVPGDEFYVGGQIFNQSKENQKIKVKFESQTLILKEKENEKEIKIAPDKSETVYFKVQAPPQTKDGFHQFVISAISEKLQDVVEQKIKITPNNTYEVVASSNYTDLPIFKEYVFLPENIEKDRGELTIKSSATLANFLSDGLNYLLGFPYGCSEQIASRLNAIAIVKRGLNLPNIGEKFNLKKIEYQDKEYTIDEIVQIGLSELYNNQQPDGGFSFWRGGKSDFYLTLHILETFNNLSLAGYSVNESALNQAFAYLKREINRGRWNWESEEQYKNRLILTAYVFSQLPDQKQSQYLKEQIARIIQDDLFLQERITNDNLAYLAIFLAKNQGFSENLKNKVFKALDNRIDIDGRGAFLGMNNIYHWWSYGTTIKNTALYLKSQVAQKSENPILEKVLRWILNSREKDGSWGSTQNTLTVVDALTDFLEWKKETNSNFNLEILVNEKSQVKFNFNPDSILDQIKKEIPIKELKFNQNNVISFKKENLNQLPNAYYYDLALRYYLPADQISPRDEGFTIKRDFYQLDDKKNENPVLKGKVGEILRAHLQIIVPKTRNFVAIEDFIPAGMEIVNLELATEQKSLRLQEKELTNREIYPDFKEIRDDRLFLFVEHLEPGIYEFDYFVRPLIKGKFIQLPAITSEMYFPENFGRTSGTYFEVE